MFTYGVYPQYGIDAIGSVKSDTGIGAAMLAAFYYPDGVYVMQFHGSNPMRIDLLIRYRS